MFGGKEGGHGASLGLVQFKTGSVSLAPHFSEVSFHSLSSQPFQRFFPVRKLNLMKMN
jgi:hypothetical protein